MAGSSQRMTTTSLAPQEVDGDPVYLTSSYLCKISGHWSLEPDGRHEHRALPAHGDLVAG